MSDKLRDEIARAMAEAANDYDGDVLQYVPYRVSADAILPIIARVRDEARATERASIVHWLRQYGACMADGDTFADEIERGWHLLK